MSPTTTVYFYIRQILELLYFAANIVIAVCVIKGLEQLKLTRRIANETARRESIRAAIAQCQYFAEKVVPELPKMALAVGKENVGRLFPPNPVFTIQNGEIELKDFDAKTWDTEYPKIGGSVVNFLNSLEFFAIPFAHGVADEELGFKETGNSFSQMVRILIPALFNQRRKDYSGRFESTINLFDLWTKRRAANALAPALKSLEELTKAIEQQRIKPV